MGLSREDFESLTRYCRIAGFDRMNSPSIHQVDRIGGKTHVWITWPARKDALECVWSDEEGCVVLADGSSDSLVSELCSSTYVGVAPENIAQLIREWLDCRKITQEDAERLRKADSVSCSEAMDGVMFSI